MIVLSTRIGCAPAAVADQPSRTRRQLTDQQGALQLPVNGSSADTTCPRYSPEVEQQGSSCDTRQRVRRSMRQRCQRLAAGRSAGVALDHRRADNSPQPNGACAVDNAALNGLALRAQSANVACCARMGNGRAGATSFRCNRDRARRGAGSFPCCPVSPRQPLILRAQPVMPGFTRCRGDSRRRPRS